MTIWLVCASDFNKRERNHEQTLDTTQAAMIGEYPKRRDFFSLKPLNSHFVNSLMLPLPRLGGAHLSRIAAYMGLALHEMSGGYALWKMSDASSCVISLILIFW